MRIPHRLRHAHSPGFRRRWFDQRPNERVSNRATQVPTPLRGRRNQRPGGRGCSTPTPAGFRWQWSTSRYARVRTERRRFRHARTAGYSASVLRMLSLRTSLTASWAKRFRHARSAAAHRRPGQLDPRPGQLLPGPWSTPSPPESPGKAYDPRHARSGRVRRAGLSYGHRTRRAGATQVSTCPVRGLLNRGPGRRRASTHLAAGCSTSVPGQLHHRPEAPPSAP